MQQYLPFTVLKLSHKGKDIAKNATTVATVLTVYGIETDTLIRQGVQDEKELQQYLPFTVLKLIRVRSSASCLSSQVATVLTVYGIETYKSRLR